MGFLEEAGVIEVRWDDQGRPTNVQILRGGGIVSAPSVGGGKLTVTSPEEPEPPQGHEDGS